MGDVVEAMFGCKPVYEEALFRQALRKELDENGGILTTNAIEAAYVSTLEVAKLYKENDPDQLRDYVDITYALLEREQKLAGEHWRP